MTQKIQIPDSIKIGPLTFTVRIDSEMDEILNESNVFGRCVMARQEINVLSTLKDDQKQAVFIHELVHAMIWVSGFNGVTQQQFEENFTNTFSMTLFQVLIENNLICSITS